MSLISVNGQGLLDTIIQIREVNIKASKTLEETGLVVTKLDTLVLQQSLTGSLSELLSEHTPVFIKSCGPGSLSSASFRGTAASHTQVYWNGININSPMVGQVDFSLIPVYFIDKLSIYHGGSSLHQGSGALGGSIHMNSVPNWNQDIDVSIVQEIGSFNTYQTFANVKTGGAKSWGSVKLIHQQSENDFRYFNDANGLWNMTRQKNADFQKYGGMGEFYLKPDNKNLLSIHTWLHFSNRNLPPIMSYEGKGRDEYQNDDQIRMSARWKHYNDFIKMELTSGISRTSLDYYLANQTNLGLLVNYDSQSNITGYQNRFLLEYNRWRNIAIRTTMNVNHYKASITNHNEKTGYRAKRDEAGLHMNVHASINPFLSLFGLLRQELIDGKIIGPMPSAGLELHPFKTINLSLTSNITRNYHQPSLNDLYWIPGGNPNLQPEEGYTADGAVKYRFNDEGRLNFETKLAGYASHINDWILWQPSEYRYWTANNVKEVFARGIEYSASGSFTNNLLTIKFNGNYAFTRTTNQESYHPSDQSVGKQLIYIPIHQANGLLNIESGNYYLTYKTSFTGERHTTTDNSVNVLPSFTLHHLTFGARLKISNIHTEWQLKINNLLNKGYQAVLWRAMPGRHYAFAVKVDI